ncbi:MAG: hypothetical protein RIC35_24840 [Marinoscillum sp.]
MTSFKILFLLIAAFACENALAPCEKQPFTTYEWLGEMRDQLNDSGNQSSITQYLYKGECVYLVAACEDCADGMSTVYDTNGENICLFGGIAGFNSCPDFSEQATNAKVIFKKE